MPTDWFCKPDGDDANYGDTYAKAKATLAGLESVTYGAGDRLIVAPGVYRATAAAAVVTLNDGGTEKRKLSSTDRVSVTEGSKTVTGTGTAWAGSIRERDILYIPWLAYATDGVGTAGAGYSSATAAFEATIDEFCINIQGQGSYRIATVTPPNNITLGDINGVGWPAAAGGQTFWVPSGEGGYEIESVESNTSLTLRRPWSGPTYSGRAHEIIRPVYLIGDETGALTDGIGGIVRITGSLNDQTATGTNCIHINSENYWVIRGFQLDTTTGPAILVADSKRVTIEDCRILNTVSEGIDVNDDSDMLTVRRCAIFGGAQITGISMDGNGIKWTDGMVIENVYVDCYEGFYIKDLANLTIKDCSPGMAMFRFLYTGGALSAGAATFLHDCEIHYCADDAVDAAVLGQVVANWNNYWGNNVDRVNVGVVGATNTSYIYIPTPPILLDKYRYPVRLFPPSEWWANAQYDGLYPANEDMYGVLRPTLRAKRSLGTYQDFYATHNAVTTYAGNDASLEHVDARRTQFRIPTSGPALTATVWVYLQAAYAGIAPKLIVWQPNQTAVEDTASGTTGAWEQLTVSFTPAAAPPYIWVELVSDNTALAGAYAVYWQELSVTP